MPENTQIALKFSDDYPYEIDEDTNPGADLKPADWAHRAARGVLADLSDRRGIKWELQKVDTDTRKDIVAALAEIIRLAHSEANELSDGAAGSATQHHPTTL